MQLHRDREKFDAAGARLVVIGQGTPKHAANFRDQFDVQGLQTLVDPDRATYKMAGTKIGSVTELLGPRSVLRGIQRSVSERMVQGATQGNAAQLGGVLVIAQNGDVTWAHLAEDAADNPSNEEVLAAVKDAAGAADSG